MFPATSLPQEVGTPGRVRTRSLDVRSVALFQLSYRSRMNFGLLISDCGLADLGRYFFLPVSILKSQSAIGRGASYRSRTGVSALATPCLEPTGPTMQREFLIAEFGLRIRLCRPTGCYRCDLLRFQIRIPKSAIGLVGEDRIELSPRVPRTRMLALHHTPKECPKSQVQCPKSAFPILTLDFGRWTLDYPLTQTTCLISATIFTRSLWLRITALMSL